MTAHRALRASRRAGSPRRWALCVAMLVAAPFVGGAVSVLLVIAAAFVVIDVIVPLPMRPEAEAEERFARAARRRRRAPQLDLVDDGAGWAAAAQHRVVGVELVRIASITGTTEESKARLFDRAFRPDRSCADRWKALWMAQARGLDLPPVSVYRIGDHHVLRDGHHRVSVARAHGRAEIEAEVVELR